MASLTCGCTHILRMRMKASIVDLLVITQSYIRRRLRRHCSETCPGRFQAGIQKLDASEFTPVPDTGLARRNDTITLASRSVHWPRCENVTLKKGSMM